MRDHDGLDDVITMAGMRIWTDKELLPKLVSGIGHVMTMNEVALEMNRLYSGLYEKNLSRK